jgi:hypothetical protein
LPGGASETITDKGLVKWSDLGAVCSGYLRLEQTGKLNIARRLKVPDRSSKLAVTVNGTSFTIAANNKAYQNIAVGEVTITTPGYVKVELQGKTKIGSYFAEVSDFIIYGQATATGVTFANDPDNFYWSRRGPSVHLGYVAPPEIDVEWFYNEVTVPGGKIRSVRFL